MLHLGTRIRSDYVLPGMPTWHALDLKVILSHIWLDNRTTNITQELSRIFKAFSDFRLVAQIREEIEKVKPSLAFTEVATV